ncbi:unnamed protein product [Acanthosepion pharaonis]|uniref:Uncharacterized protein n=1 Tax=Acanthosepion pharaonis TaxID=158019 RepID=A0A812CGV4_ACAPH|nr:unnamed protein product [Sepia pharaonis]
MHSRASLYCPVDNIVRLFNHRQTSKATIIISIIPTTVSQVIIATQFSLQPEFGVPILSNSDFNRPIVLAGFLEQAPTHTTTSAVHAWGRLHSSPALMINAQLVSDRHSFITATVLVSLNPWAQAAPLPSIAVLAFFFFPKVRLNPCFLRMSRWAATYLPQPSKGISTRAFTFLPPTNRLQVKSGPSFSKRYTCAFLFSVCSLPPRRGSRGPPGWGGARMTLFSRTRNPFLPSIRVRVVPFGVDRFILRGQVHLRCTTCRKVPDHPTCLASQRSYLHWGHPASYFFTGDPTAFPGPFSFSVGGTSILTRFIPSLMSPSAVHHRALCPNSPQVMQFDPKDLPGVYPASLSSVSTLARPPACSLARANSLSSLQEISPVCLLARLSLARANSLFPLQEISSAGFFLRDSLLGRRCCSLYSPPHDFLPTVGDLTDFSCPTASFNVDYCGCSCSVRFLLGHDFDNSGVGILSQ